ncbi:hypothetical protein HDV63DRAFT_384706 [Trichoderma sp. SZMC 28014]
MCHFHKRNVLKYWSLFFAPFPEQSNCHKLVPCNRSIRLLAVDSVTISGLIAYSFVLFGLTAQRIVTLALAELQHSYPILVHPSSIALFPWVLILSRM